MANQAVYGDVTFHVGDTIRVHYKLIEKEKVAGKTKREVKEEVRERIQVFEGVVISIKGEGAGKMFTVRRIAVGNIGIERIFPLVSPWVKKITVKAKAHVRRAKLYFLRKKTNKEAEKLVAGVMVINPKVSEKKLKVEEVAPVAPVSQNEQSVPPKAG